MTTETKWWFVVRWDPFTGDIAKRKTSKILHQYQGVKILTKNHKVKQFIELYDFNETDSWESYFHYNHLVEITNDESLVYLRMNWENLLPLSPIIAIFGIRELEKMQQLAISRKDARRIYDQALKELDELDTIYELYTECKHLLRSTADINFVMNHKQQLKRLKVLMERNQKKACKMETKVDEHDEQFMELCDTFKLKV